MEINYASDIAVHFALFPFKLDQQPVHSYEGKDLQSSLDSDSSSLASTIYSANHSPFKDYNISIASNDSSEEFNENIKGTDLFHNNDVNSHPNSLESKS